MQISFLGEKYHQFAHRVVMVKCFYMIFVCFSVCLTLFTLSIQIEMLEHVIYSQIRYCKASECLPFIQNLLLFFFFCLFGFVFFCFFDQSTSEKDFVSLLEMNSEWRCLNIMVTTVNIIFYVQFIMPPTSNTLDEHIASGWFVCASVLVLRFFMHSITSESYMLGF